MSKAKVLGRVLDEETGEPLIFVTVYITETKTGAVTDINGFFTIALVPGKYNVQIEYLGYEKGKYLLDCTFRTVISRKNEKSCYSDEGSCCKR